MLIADNLELQQQPLKAEKRPRWLNNNIINNNNNNKEQFKLDYKVVGEKLLGSEQK